METRSSLTSTMNMSTASTTLTNLARCLFALTLVAMLAACGGSKTPAKVYDVGLSSTAIQKAGWKATETKGMPDTLTKAKQVSYLETIAPDGQKLDVQFFEDAKNAEDELAAAQKQDASFHGDTFRNAIIFSHADGKTAAPSADVDALHNLLQ